MIPYTASATTDTASTTTGPIKVRVTSSMSTNGDYYVIQIAQDPVAYSHLYVPNKSDSGQEKKTKHYGPVVKTKGGKIKRW